MKDSSGKEKKKHININKFPGLSGDWVGAKILFFMCFFFFFFFRGSFLMGEKKKHINKITPKIPGQSREIFVYVFFSSCVSYPLVAGSPRPNPKMGAPGPENPLFLGFSVLRGGPRPWSETMVSEGARPRGRGRSGVFRSLTKEESTLISFFFVGWKPCCPKGP